MPFYWPMMNVEEPIELFGRMTSTMAVENRMSIEDDFGTI
jgi:hypothetical protein